VIYLVLFQFFICFIFCSGVETLSEYAYFVPWSREKRLFFGQTPIIRKRLVIFGVFSQVLDVFPWLFGNKTNSLTFYLIQFPLIDIGSFSGFVA